MPRLDKTGPRGAGPGTGWGLGPCSGGMGRSRSMRGMMRGWFDRRWTAEDQKTALTEEEKYLEQELEAIRKEQATLKDQK